MIGRIYRIIHLESDVCYVGSTMNELRKRWQQHRQDFQKYLKGGHDELAIYPFMKQFGEDQFKLILVKEYEVADRKHLCALETLWMNKFAKTCVNKKRPFYIPEAARAHDIAYRKQYRGANAEQIKLKDRTRYQLRKDKLNAKTQCECGSIVSYSNRAAHKKTAKHQQWLSDNQL